MKCQLIREYILKKQDGDADIDFEADSAAAAEAAALPEADVPPPEDDGHRRPITLYRHWVR